MLTDSELNTLYEVLPPAPFQVLSLTVGEFLRCITRPDFIDQYSQKHAVGVVEQVKLAKGIVKAIKDLMDVIKAWQPPLTPEQQHAAEGVKYPNFAESVLLEMVDAYHLHSTAEAEQHPLADWYIVHKQRSAEARYNYNYNTILAKKHEQAVKH